MSFASLARATAGALALTVLAGCGGTESFTVKQQFEIDGTGTQTETIVVNLAEEAGDAWDHRDKIEKAKITFAAATIREVLAGTTTGATVSGEAAIARGAQSATVASGTNLPVEAGQVYTPTNLDGAVSIVEDALDGDGNLEVTYTATVQPGGATAHFIVEVLIDVEVEWKLF